MWSSCVRGRALYLYYAWRNTLINQGRSKNQEDSLGQWLKHWQVWPDTRISLEAFGMLLGVIPRVSVASVQRFELSKLNAPNSLQAMTNVWCQNIRKNIVLAETMFYPMFWLKKSENHWSELPNMVNITKFCGKTLSQAFQCLWHVLGQKHWSMPAV